MLIGGAILIIAGVWFGIASIPAKDWLQGIFSIIAIAVGFALISGRGITVSS